METGDPNKLQVLLGLGVPIAAIEIPVSGALYLESVGGPPLSSYWNKVDPEIISRQRDEFFLVGTTTLAVARCITTLPHQNEWRFSFDIAYLFQIKPLIQAIKSIDILCGARCYSDALSVIRALQSRAQQLVLFSLGPHLFKEWAQNPRHEKFLDGHIRDELSNHGIHVFSYLYDQLSELIHGHLQALSEAGYFEKGCFPEILPVANMVFVSAKFLMGVIGWAGVCALLLDQDGSKEGPTKLKALSAIYSAMLKDILHPGRLDHLWTMIAEDRHWEKAGKETFIVAKLFQFEEYQRQLGLFHRRSQPKFLGKRYRSVGDSVSK